MPAQAQWVQEMKAELVIVRALTLKLLDATLRVGAELEGNRGLTYS